MTFSVRRRLFWLLLMSLVGLSAGASIVTYLQARSDVNNLLDGEMEQMTHMLGVHITAHPELSQEPLLQVEYDSVVQIWDKGEKLLFSSLPGDGPDRLLPPGFSHFSARHGGWRTYTAGAGDYMVQVAQPSTHRRELAAGIALRAMLPVAATLPVGGVIVWLLVTYGLKPLRLIAREVESRDPSSLEPISAIRLPTEVAPLVNALNDLLNRLGRALRLERQFIADASHELRTPVSALSLQVELLETAGTPAERDDSIQDIKRSIERVKRLIGQILTMARLDPEFVESAETIDLLEFVREIEANFSIVATAKSITLHVHSNGQRRININCDAVSLRALLGNLVDNAVRYSPSGGAVTMELDDQNGTAVIRVIDSGPGIPEEARSKLFARFSRGDCAEQDHGVGLGLAIAKRAAERLGVKLELKDRPGGKGLAAIIEFPHTAISIPAIG